ncbi:MAG: DsbA family protein [Bradymonadaceae bacterium]
MAVQEDQSGDDTTKILGFIVVAVIAFAGGYVVSTMSGTADDKAQSAKQGSAAAPSDGGFFKPSDKIPVGDSPVKGPKDAKITIVEFSEFQCPFCQKVQGTLDKVMKNYSGKVRIVFKHYPLPFHKQAKPASRVALAAKEQGKFWEMHDKLYANQKSWKNGDVTKAAEKYAKQIGLDVEQFKKDLKNNKSKYNKIIKQETKLGKKLGVKGTPHLFVNGERISGAQPYSKFKSVIESKLEQADEMLSGGVAKSALYKKAVQKNFEEPSKPKKKKGKKKKTKVSYVKIDDSDPVTGAKKDYLVTLVEFSDFQCPFCKKAFPSIKKLKKNFGDKVRFVFKHRPLPFHNNAGPAAKAAIAAQKQGKFWEMHDMLFENQKSWKKGDVLETASKYAEKLGMNVEKFKSDFKSSATADKLSADKQQAGKVGAKGTPTFFINGVKVVGAQPYSKFESVVKTQIDRAQKLKKEKGLSGEELYKAVVKLNKKKAGGGGGGSDKPSPKKKKPTKVDTDKLKIGQSPVKGPKDAPVTIYEFSDFECPYCQKAHSTLKKVLPDYEGKYKLVHKHYPLPFHKQAKPAARAAIAAQKQGKFWEMYELLFKNQKKLGQDGLYTDLANKIGLNVEKFKKDMKSSSAKERISQDMKLGKSVGVKGTPAFFINGQRLVGAQPASKFRSAIDSALKNN